MEVIYRGDDWNSKRCSLAVVKAVLPVLICSLGL